MIVADDDKTGSTGSTGGGTSSGFTQADVDRIVADRLARERSRYADYDDLKKKAGDADKQKSDVDKLTAAVQALTDRAEKAERETLRRKVADRHKLPAFLADKLSGATEADLDREAKDAVEALKALGVKFDGDAGQDGGKDGGSAGKNDAGKSGDGRGTGGDAGKGDDTGGNPLLSGRPKEDLKSGAVPAAGSDTVDFDKEADAIFSGSRII